MDRMRQEAIEEKEKHESERQEMERRAAEFEKEAEALKASLSEAESAGNQEKVIELESLLKTKADELEKNKRKVEEEKLKHEENLYEKVLAIQELKQQLNE